MPFQDVSAMSQRLEFIALATAPEANIRELARRFHITPKTAYKWRNRYEQDGLEGLLEQSRRPHNSPTRTPKTIQDKILALRDQHPAWGARKLARRLQDLGENQVPHPSTITDILRREGRLDPKQSDKHKAHQRFEREEPHALWQMDFKGHLPMNQGRCHPLTILDDHSRFAICLHACPDERMETVQDALITCFERYGLPQQILTDNGAPFGTVQTGPDPAIRSFTRLELWLMRQQITPLHGRPAHPQTQGKEERFHRTLLAEALRSPLRDLAHSQQVFDAFRQVYNHERPHEALSLATPASRFTLSPRCYRPDPPIEYEAADQVRRVQAGGDLHFQGRVLRVNKALRGYPVAIRPTLQDGIYDVYFCTTRIARFDLTDSPG
jgi:transposase InsO family protein